MAARRLYHKVLRKYVWRDEYNNPIPAPEGSPEYESDPSLTIAGEGRLAPDTTLRVPSANYTPQFDALNPRPIPPYSVLQFGKDLVQNLPGLGGLIGAGFGGGTPLSVPLAISGAATGSVIKDAVQRGSPEVGGEPEGDINSQWPILGHALREGGLEAVMPMVPKVIGLLNPFDSSVRRNLAQRAMGSFFEMDPKIPRSDVTPRTSFDLTIPQVSERGKYVAESFAHKKYEGVVRNQREQIADTIRRWAYQPETVMDVAKTNALAQKSNMEAMYDFTKSNMQTHANANMRNVPIMAWDATAQKMMPRVERVVGAIEPTQSLAFAKSKSAELRSLLDSKLASNADLRSSFGGEFTKLEGELNKLTSIQPSYRGDAPVEALDRLQVTRDSITRSINALKTKVDGTDPLIRGLETLRTTIENDIRNGVKGWGRSASRDYGRAQAAQMNFARQTNPGLANKLLNAGASPAYAIEEISKEALLNPTNLREFRHLANDANRSVTSKMFLNKMISENIDQAKGGFDYQGILRSIEANDALFKEALTPRHQREVLDTLKKAQHVGDVGQGVQKALGLTLGRSAISVGAGIGTGVLGSLMHRNINVFPYYSGGLLLGLSAMHTLTKKMLFDKKYADLAMGLVQADPASAKAQALSKLILAGLKGERIFLEGKDGKQVETYVDDQGQIVPPKVDMKIPVPDQLR
jgi:hypothetical protein